MKPPVLWLAAGIAWGCADDPAATADAAPEPRTRHDAQLVDARGPGVDAGDADGGDRGDPDARPAPDAEATPDARPDEGRPPRGVDAATADPDAAPPDAVVFPGCPQLDRPSAPLQSPLADLDHSGRFEAVRAGAFHDEYLYDADDYVKVGVRREWGASIVYYGLADAGAGMNEANVIDANDTGREVQVAFYDPDRIRQGCAHDASCGRGAECPGSIRYLGWNPVQGGNRCNVGSPVDQIVGDGGRLRAVVVPLQWNPDWDAVGCEANSCGGPDQGRRGDLRVTQSVRFVRRHVLELDYTIENLSDLDHASTAQELPTLYTANGRRGPDLWRVMKPDGTQVTVDNPANDGFFNRRLETAEPWVSLQNDDLTYGVAIVYENGLRTFTAWQNRDLPFNNVRADFSFAIPARGTIRARAYLLLGGLATNRADATWLLGALAPFGSLDAPTELPGGGAAEIRGWALDNRGVARVFARVDGEREVPLEYGGQRPDVCRVWPGYPRCAESGYSGRAELGDPGCPHTVEVFAVDGDGNERLVGSRLLTP